MWRLEPSAEYQSRHRTYEKKHPRELRAVLANLEKFMAALKAGAKPQQVKVGFIHPEPRGVLAIDQKGGGRSLAETRLYVYPDDETETIHVIMLGDKKSQRADIQVARAFVDTLRKARNAEHGE